MFLNLRESWNISGIIWQLIDSSTDSWVPRRSSCSSHKVCMCRGGAKDWARLKSSHPCVCIIIRIICPLGDNYFLRPAAEGSISHPGWNWRVQNLSATLAATPSPPARDLMAINQCTCVGMEYKNYSLVLKPRALSVCHMVVIVLYCLLLGWSQI